MLPTHPLTHQHTSVFWSQPFLPPREGHRKGCFYVIVIAVVVMSACLLESYLRLTGSCPSRL